MGITPTTRWQSHATNINIMKHHSMLNSVCGLKRRKKNDDTHTKKKKPPHNDAHNKKLNYLMKKVMFVFQKKEV